MLTKLQREELDLDLKHANDDGFRVLNVRQHRDWPTWVVFGLWCMVWVLIGVLAVFAFDKLEALGRVRWPRL